MRILLASTSSGSRGGGEFFLVYLGQALKELGAEPALWISADPQMDELAALFEGTGPVLRHPYQNTYLRRSRTFSHLLPSGSSLAPILRQWKEFQPDVLHLNKQCLEDGLDLLDLGSMWNVPQGCTIHITQTAVVLKAFMGSARDWIARRALRRYRGELWAISEQRAVELGAFIGQPGPVRFIPNGVRVPTVEHIAVERERMRRSFFGEKQPRGPVAVCVGRIEEQKDPFRFLEIMQAWKGQEPDLTAVWVGDGRLRKPFEERIQAMGAREWIHCAGWQPDPLPFLCMADVYVHPARFEGLPFALLEAMAHRLPCVLSPSLAHELKDIPIDTWIIAGPDPSSWLRSLGDAALLDQLAGKSRDLATDVFSVQAMAKSYLRLYDELLRDRGEK